MCLFIFAGRLLSKKVSSNNCHPHCFFPSLTADPDPHLRRAVDALHSSAHRHLPSGTPPTSETAVTMTTGGCCHLPGSLCDCASSAGLWKSMEEGSGCGGGGDGDSGCPALYVTQVTSMDGHLLSSVLKPVSAQRWDTLLIHSVCVRCGATHTPLDSRSRKGAHSGSGNFPLFKCPNKSSSNKYTLYYETKLISFTRVIFPGWIPTTSQQHCQ